MKSLSVLPLLCFGFSALGIGTMSYASNTPPVAEKIPHLVQSPSGDRLDPYYWLRDDSRTNEKILAHLRAEKAYYEAHAQSYQDVTDTLSKEIIGRIKQDDSSVPVKWRDYAYYSRYDTGKEYPIMARKSLKSGEEQVMIDANVEAEGKGFYALANSHVSENQNILAYAEDTSGRRQFTLRFRDLTTGKNLTDVISGTSGAMAWAKDNKTLFYIENDAKTLLSTRVKKHVLGSDPSKDSVVYEETDKSFYMGVSNTKDRSFIAITLSSTISSEMLLIDAAKPESNYAVFAAREDNVKYDAEYMAGHWYISTDWNAPNNKLMKVAHKSIGDKHKWQPLVAENKNIFIDSFDVFTNYLVIAERSDGLRRLKVQPWNSNNKPFYIESGEAAYSALIDANRETNTDTLRYSYTSLTTPVSVFEINMASGKKELLKETAVLGGFDKRNYITDRVWVTARDGAKIPVSLLYKNGYKKNGTAPLYQYAYGSYGSSSDPVFRSNIFSLIDRGFVFAIAHIRGGQEMGRQWYEDGKMLHKKNTFTDFIDVTQYLVDHKYAAKDNVFAMGGSAGGLLMGAIANMAGEKYKGLIAHVPFVDVVTTMLDESIPLTTNEFDEWGNPKNKLYYDYMLSYSPYDQVTKKAYPAMLVTTGLHDSQVQYYEPAKWVARLREFKTDNNPLFFKINLEAGHGGKSGRFQRLKESAEEYAFILRLLDDAKTLTSP